MKLKDFLNEQELKSVLKNKKDNIDNPNDLDTIPNEDIPDEGVEEEPEEDISLLPYSEKIKIVITMLQEFGFSNVDYKIDDGKNTLLVKGKLESADKSALIGLGKELGLKINIEEKTIGDESIMTVLKFDNIIDLDKFLNVYKKIKSKEKEEKPAF